MYTTTLPRPSALSRPSALTVPTGLATAPRSTRSGSRYRGRVGQMPVRPADRRPAPARPAPSAAGTRCPGGVGARATYRRRRAAAVAVLVGAGLAALVWTIGLIGADYQEATTPSPTGTEVVHVRAGESLNTLADRVAPDVPREVVVADIIDLNDMSGSGVRVGQPLLAPAYR